MMNEEVALQIQHLKVGSPYLFDHIRKGPMVGEFKGTCPTDPGDMADAFFIEVDLYTEEGSGQERLANSFIRDELGRKMRPPISKKLIRPSLLRSITRPSAEGQKILLDRFTRIRAEAVAIADGGEPILTTLAMPTKQAMSHLSSETEVEKKSWWQKIFRR